MKTKSLSARLLAFYLLLAFAEFPYSLHAQSSSDRSHPIVQAARKQIGITLRYDPAYVRLDYPEGDVPIDRGVCSDVVIRALRAAYKIDLQKLLHEDMRAHFDKYPSKWKLTRPDPHIDHRRVLNLQVFFARKGLALTSSENALPRFLPGDLLTCTVPPNLPHIVIISDKSNAQGTPLILHNIGYGTVEEDKLYHFPHTGHYRLTPEFIRRYGR